MMHRINTVLEELKGLSLYSPIRQLKLLEFRHEIESAFSNKEIDKETLQDYKRKYLERDEFDFSIFHLYKFCSSSNFILQNFEMSKFLEYRKELYKFIKNIRCNSVTFEQGFISLLNELKEAMETEQESFWDSFFVLITCLQLNANVLQTDPFYENRVLILQIIKYAAELEGRLVNGTAKDKMKLFADISPEIGKDIAIKFHFIKAAFISRDEIEGTLWKIVDGNPAYSKQPKMLQMLCENQCKFKHDYSIIDLVSLFLNNTILFDYMWLLSNNKQEIINNLVSYAYDLIDYNVYSFIVFTILNDKMIDNVAVKSEREINELYKKLDTYNVEYYEFRQ